jgi:hypothetical protein
MRMRLLAELLDLLDLARKLLGEGLFQRLQLTGSEWGLGQRDAVSLTMVLPVE